jgi:predicted nucleic acid-binding protein
MSEDKIFIDTNIMIYAYDVSAWDSMIIEAAIKGGAVFLMSEDLQHGQVISGVTIRNPFKD